MGIGLVLGALGVGVMIMMVIQINKLKNKCKQLEEVQGHIFNDINRIDESINRRIDGEIERTDRLFTETNRFISENISNVYRSMDSRLDRLTSKLTSPVGDKVVLKD